MKKWFQIFSALTVAIILITSFSIWISMRDEVATLAYVPDSDWSDAIKITPELKGNKYDVITDGQGQIHTFWLEYLPPVGAVDLMHYSADAKGKEQTAAKLIAHNAQLPAFTLGYSDERIHLFYTGLVGSEQFGLFYVQLNQSGEVLHNQKIKGVQFYDVGDLQVHPTPEQNLMLVWSDAKLNQPRQVKTLLLSTEGEMLGEPTQVTFTESDSRTPKLLIDEKERYHLTWREEYAYNYDLFYQKLDSKGGSTTTTPRKIDRVSVNPASMGVHGDELYLVWTKRMTWVGPRQSMIDKAFPNYELFGAVMDLTQPEEELQIQRLTAQNGPSFEHTMGVNPDGQIHLVYIDTYHNHLGLTHRVFEGDFLTESKEARRLYPNQINGSGATLITDPNGEFHLIWLEATHSGGYVHYANTIHAKTADALEVVGFNSGNYTVSIIMSLFYLAVVPIFFMLLHLHWVALIILANFVDSVCDALGVRMNMKDLMKHPVTKVVVACLLQVLIYLAFGRARWIFGSSLPTGPQIWFVMILSSVATLALVMLTHKEFHRFTASKIGLYAGTFFFWVHLVSLTYSLPMINYFFDMIDISVLFGLL